MPVSRSAGLRCLLRGMRQPQTRPVRVASERARRSIGSDIERLRLDSGLSRRALAAASGVPDSFLGRVEAGTSAGSLETYLRVAVALGADLSIRLYPNTGPAIRDRHQAGILAALLGQLHPRWIRFAEVAVRRPSRGWIDVALLDERAGVLVAVEIQSELRRLEQLIRWSDEKAVSLPSWEGWGRLASGSPTISKLLVIRETRTTRAVARENRRQLAVAYPADPRDALESICATAAWPGAAVLWARGRGTAAAPWQLVAVP